MFDNLSIKIKYSIPLGMALISLLAITFSSFLLTNKLESNANIFPEKFMPAINAVINADRDLYQARVAEIQLVNSTELSNDFINDIHENAQQAKNRFNKYRDLMQAYPDVLNSLQNFDTLYNRWLDEVNNVISTNNNDKTAAINLVNSTSKRYFSELRKLYDVAGEGAFTKAGLLKKDIEDSNSNSKILTMTIAIFIFIITSIAAIYSQKLLLMRLNEIKVGIDDITSGGGDLTHQIEIKQNDEIGDLGKAFNQFVESLRGLISDVKNNVDELCVSSTTLKNSAKQGQDVADSQSSASDMIISAVHEMSMSTKELATIALDTADETKNAITFTQTGVTKISESVVQIKSLYSTIESASEGTKKLSDDSHNISNVLEVIRGIADQTNLLALNAAIEAARAGEQGRGFAVVADEVRSLAQKTQESTESIQGMIESLQSGVDKVVEQIGDGFEKVSNTVELATETESSLNHILSSVTTVSDMSFRTATATEEQTSVTDDINQNLHEFNGQIVITKEISSDTNNSSNEIELLAKHIEAGVDRFKVK